MTDELVFKVLIGLAVLCIAAAGLDWVLEKASRGWWND